MRRSKFRRLRVLAVWALISVLMQVGFLYFLEKQINGGPVEAIPPQKPPVVVEKVVNLPGSQANDLKASYAKDYLAYTDDKGLQVFNVKTSKVVFTENKPATGDILGYTWLPDKNALLLVMREPVKTKKGLQTNLYAIEFPKPDEDLQPDKREPQAISGFPADGQIEAMDLSTMTNLVYTWVKTPRGQIIYEINVMNKLRTVPLKPGEIISNMVASDVKGTLYLQSRVGNIDQIVAYKGNGRREQVLMGSQYVLLGVVQDNKAFKVLVGKVQDNNLTQILSVPDTSPQEKTAKNTTVEWQGSVPWKKDFKAVTGPNNYWVLYNQDEAVAFQNGTVKPVKFTSPENYLTPDGREYMQVDSTGGTVKVTIKPL